MTLNAKALEALRKAKSSLATGFETVSAMAAVDDAISALSSIPQAGVSEEAVEAAVEVARFHLEIDGDNNGPFIRFDSIDAAVRAILASSVLSSQQEEAVPVVTPRYGYSCYACRAMTPPAFDMEKAERLAGDANWHLGLDHLGQAHYACPNCSPNLLNVRPLIPLPTSPVPADAGEPTEALEWRHLARQFDLMAKGCRSMGLDSVEDDFDRLRQSAMKGEVTADELAELIDYDYRTGQDGRAAAHLMFEAVLSDLRSALVPATSQAKGSE